MKRLINSIRIDKDSYETILIAWCICAILIWLNARFIHNPWISIPISVILVVFMCFITWFFRVPDRTVPDYENDRLVTSVADGKVVILEKVFEKEYLQRDCIQISVYMDFFDVHCNFWPVNGKVTYYKYHPGKYLLAFHPKSSELNEHSSSCLKNKYGEVFSSRSRALSRAASSAIPSPATWRTAATSAASSSSAPASTCSCPSTPRSR